jgi:hypothetical protein
MALSNKRIIIGGWKAFAEEAGVNKKEPMENFDWLPSEEDKMYYNDMRAALDKVEGSRDFVKNYVYVKGTLPFGGTIGNALANASSVGHSGASASSILWSYQNALKDWDNFVFKTKEYKGLREYKSLQVPIWQVENLLMDCHAWIVDSDWHPADAAELEKTIKLECAKLCLTGTVREIKAILTEILEDLNAIELNENIKKNERQHTELLESLEFLYENPIRWFDTPSGCTLSPRHPTYITEKAMTDMEKKTPGYKKHIENVLVAMGSPRKPSYTDHGIFSVKGTEMWNAFLKEQKVIQ